jgi:hypothetical protein
LIAAFASSWSFTPTAWFPSAAAQQIAQGPQLKLDQQTVERQQILLADLLRSLPAHRGGPAQVWGIVFAPYAGEDVFLRESAMVADVLAQRFDARGRVVQLVNHDSTVATHPWATPLNLQRTIEAVAGRMDLDQDVLVLYLTSHGGGDFTLSARHSAFEVEPMTAPLLREMLDAAGIKYRVIAVSACFSGGWVEPLASDTTLVMTAADSEHTSYGCGSKSELTFFGRAVFDEQLRTGTRSFEEAFARAVPVIRERERQAHKSDGFSNPQLRVGAAIRPVLAALQVRLERGETRK